MKDAVEFAKFTSNGCWYYEPKKDLWRSGPTALTSRQLYRLYLKSINN